MTVKTIVLVLSERPVKDNIYLTDTGIWVRETEKFASLVLFWLFGGIILPRQVFTWVIDLKKKKNKFQPGLLI